ncbi:MAG TPA: DoxX family protein [Flavisolibacter sp.]
MNLLTGTNQRLLDTGILLVRLVAGAILFAAGAGKLFGWFGGFGLDTTLQLFSNNLKISGFWAYLSIYTEFIGGFLLAVGLFTRFAAFALLINMIVATWVSVPSGILSGASYPFSLAISALAILLTGPLRYSVDSIIARKPVVTRAPAKKRR